MFMASFGLKPGNDDDTDEAKKILEGVVQHGLS
jgi:hypothetical protein